MILEEAIKHCEELAEKCDLIAEASKTIKDNRNYRRCAEEHRQLAEWLKELQRYQWIPCSERMPTKAGHYLCSFKKPNRIDNIYVDLAYWTGGRWYGHLANAINAWMELPTKYQGEQDGQID